MAIGRDPARSPLAIREQHPDKRDIFAHSRLSGLICSPSKTADNQAATPTSATGIADTAEDRSASNVGAT